MAPSSEPSEDWGPPVKSTSRRYFKDFLVPYRFRSGQALGTFTSVELRLEPVHAHHVMVNESETTKTVTTSSEKMCAPVPCGPGETADSPAIICDLADSDAFVENFRKPHVPVMSSFGAGRLHVCRLHGSFDLNKAAADHANVLFRSIRYVHPPTRTVPMSIGMTSPSNSAPARTFTSMRLASSVLPLLPLKPKAWQKTLARLTAHQRLSPAPAVIFI